MNQHLLNTSEKWDCQDYEARNTVKFFEKIIRLQTYMFFFVVLIEETKPVVMGSMNINKNMTLPQKHFTEISCNQDSVPRDILITFPRKSMLSAEGFENETLEEKNLACSCRNTRIW